MTADLNEGREAFERQGCRAAFSLLADSHHKGHPLGLDDLESLAQAAHPCGEDAASEKAWTKATGEPSHKATGPEPRAVALVGFSLWRG